MCQCNGCGKHLSVNSIRRHKKKSCNGKGEKAGTIDSSDQQAMPLHILMVDWKQVLKKVLR